MEKNFGEGLEKRRKELAVRGTFGKLMEAYEEDVEDIEGYLTVAGKDCKVLNRAGETKENGSNKAYGFELPDDFEGPGQLDGVKVSMDDGRYRHILECSRNYDFTPIGENIVLKVSGDEEKRLKKEFDRISRKYFQKFKAFYPYYSSV